MKLKTFIWIAGLAVLASGIFVAFQKRQARPAQPDPAFYHTPDGVNATIQEQRQVLSDALRKQDLPFIHGQMYYVQGLADALSGKLEGEQKQRVDAVLQEIKRIAEEVDNFSGRGNAEATAAGLLKLFEAFDRLGAEFRRDRKQ